MVLKSSYGDVGYNIMNILNTIVKNYAWYHVGSRFAGVINGSVWGHESGVCELPPGQRSKNLVWLESGCELSWLQRAPGAAGVPGGTPRLVSR